MEYLDQSVSVCERTHSHNLADEWARLGITMTNNYFDFF